MKIIRAGNPAVLLEGDSLHSQLSLAPNRASAFFPSDPRSTGPIVERARFLEHAWRGDRRRLAEVLVEACRDRGDHPRAVAAAEALADPGSGVVVCLVRPSILGGSAEDFYLGVLCIEYARRFGEILSGRRAVPMMWVVSDHNWSAMGRLLALDSGGQAHRLNLDPMPLGRRTASAVSVEAPALRVLGRMRELQERAEGDPFFSLAARTTEDALDLADWFCLIHAHLLGPSGLVVVDSHHPPLRSLVAPKIHQYLLRAPRVAAEARVMGERLRTAGHPAPIDEPEQVAAVFVEQDGERRGVRRVGAHFRVDGAEEELSPRQFFRWLRDSPDLFSPGGTALPLVLDLHLPILAHLICEAETPLRAQLMRGYPLFDRDAPPMIPLPGMAVLDRELMEALETLELHAVDLGHGASLEADLHARRRTLLSAVDRDLDPVFDRAGASVALAYGEVEETLRGFLDEETARERAARGLAASLRPLERIRREAERTFLRSLSGEWRALRRLRAGLLPAGSAQARLALATVLRGDVRRWPRELLHCLGREERLLGSLWIVDPPEAAARDAG